MMMSGRAHGSRNRRTRETQAADPTDDIGMIVNISSLGGLFGLPFQGVYSASKFALEGLTESLRHEVMPFGIDVLAVEPGDVRTSITRNRVRAARGLAGAHARQFEAVMRVIEHDEMNGAEAATVAELVVALCERRSRRMRHTSGHISQRSAAWAKKLLPGNIFERLIRDHYLAAGRRRRDAVVRNKESEVAE